MTAVLPASPTNTRATVLVVEPHFENRQRLSQLLVQAGHRVDSCLSAEDAIRRLDSIAFEMVASGLDKVDEVAQLERWLLEHRPGVAVVRVVNADAGSEDMDLEGCFGTLRRPVALAMVEQVVDQALRGRQFHEEGPGIDNVEQLDVARRGAMGRHFDDALDHSYLVYQPIVRTRSNCVVGYEALLRTTAPRFPLARPLLKAAAHLGKSMAVDGKVQSMLAAGFEGDAQWRTFFLNLNVQTLLHGELGTDDDILKPYARRVVVEFSQDIALPITGVVLDTLERMRECGYRIAAGNIDSTTASLVRMRMLAPDIYKLGVGVVRHCDQHPTKQRYIADVVEMAHGEGALVVAQGVECPEEFNTITELGCDLGQGFMLGLPRATMN